MPTPDAQGTNASIEDYLVEAGKLSYEQLSHVRELQGEKGELLGPLLVQLGFISERELAELLAAFFHLPLAKPEQFARIFDSDILSTDFLRQHLVAPLQGANEEFVFAVADPSEPFLGKALDLAFDRKVSLSIGVVSEIQAALDSLFPEDNAIAAEREDRAMVLDQDNEDIAHLRDMASEAPVIRRVNQMVSRALELHASDIHLEPFERELVVRYRVDGVLRPISYPNDLPPKAVVSRVKVLANLNIAERRLPQDGRIRIRAEGREIDLRISTVPTLHGESVVMRLLDRRDVPLDFQALGFTEPVLSDFLGLLARPHGIVLVTGPTGSGKTTTLYAALSKLNTAEKKILTVEDPVEYRLEGINQIPIRPKIDLSFANALRAILRQDPDIIMVGEMRDVETARIAVQAALTGHKVLSTLHTNDAPSAITRLQDMHVDDYLLTSTIDGVLAQRLVRKLCPHCKAPHPAPDWLLDKLQGRFDNPAQVGTLYRARGCDACDQTGFRGRTTIAELLTMNDALRRAIIARADADSVRRIATENGMAGMFTDGLMKALAGLTTLEEIERVVQEQPGPG